MEKQRDGSAEGSVLLQVSLLSTLTINKEALVSVCLRENAQIVGRRREVHLTSRGTARMTSGDVLVLSSML